MSGSAGTLLAVGGYTAGDAPGGDGPPGLTTWWWDGSTGIHPAGSADLASPSFLCWHPTLPVLYAVSERSDGTVTTLSAAPDGSLTELASTGTGGAQPCWVTTDPIGGALLVANYGSGSMAVVGLDGDGRTVGDPVLVQHRGSGPVADRQQGPHVHQVVPTADGHVLASDLGTDEIVEYRIDPAAGSGAPGVSVTRTGVIDMPSGSGPRHITLAAGGRTGFVSGELDATVTVIRRAGQSGPTDAEPGAGRWAVGEQVPCSGRSGEPSAVQPSHLLLAGQDRWLLVANRGPDTLAVLDVAGGLRIRHEVPVGGTPRHFAVQGNRVLVACQGAGTVELLTLDETDGRLTPHGALQPESEPGSPFRAPACVAVRH